MDGVVSFSESLNGPGCLTANGSGATEPRVENVSGAETSSNGRSTGGATGDSVALS